MTILHSLHHLPDGKPVNPRMSRHYYDVYQLSNSDILDKAIADMELLERVAIHKSVFFKAGWAKYQEARPGSLKLVPGEKVLDSIKRDYDDMQPMFFRDAPSFGAIIDRLKELEQQINATA